MYKAYILAARLVYHISGKFPYADLHIKKRPKSDIRIIVRNQTFVKQNS